MNTEYETTGYILLNGDKVWGCTEHGWWITEYGWGELDEAIILSSSKHCTPIELFTGNPNYDQTEIRKGRIVTVKKRITYEIVEPVVSEGSLNVKAFAERMLKCQK